MTVSDKSGSTARPLAVLAGLSAAAGAVALVAVPAAGAAPDTIPSVACQVMNRTTVGCTAEHFVPDAVITFTLMTSTPTSGGSTASNTAAHFQAFTVHLSPTASSRELARGAADAQGSYTGQASIPSGYTGTQIIEARQGQLSAQTQIDLGAAEVAGVSNGPSAPASGSSQGAASASDSTPASTGYAIFGTGAAGVVLLAAGGFLVLAARRRRRV